MLCHVSPWPGSQRAGIRMVGARLTGHGTAEYPGISLCAKTEDDRLAHRPKLIHTTMMHT